MGSNPCGAINNSDNSQLCIICMLGELAYVEPRRKKIHSRNVSESFEFESQVLNKKLST